MLCTKNSSFISAMENPCLFQLQEPNIVVATFSHAFWIICQLNVVQNINFGQNVELKYIFGLKQIRRIQKSFFGLLTWPRPPLKSFGSGSCAVAPRNYKHAKMAAWLLCFLLLMLLMSKEPFSPPSTLTSVKDDCVQIWARMIVSNHTIIVLWCSLQWTKLFIIL